MRSLHIKVKETAFQQVLDVLSRLPEQDIEIVDEEGQKVTNKKHSYSAISIKTAKYSFNREEAHER